jgi:carboxyl-terminal processing protease
MTISRLRRHRSALLAGACVGCLLIGGAAGAVVERTLLVHGKTTAASTGQKTNLSELNQAVALIKSHYYKDDLDLNRLAHGSINGLVDALDDPYSYYLDPAQVRTAEARQSGPNVGVGLYLGSPGGPARPVVTGIAPGSPAEHRGLTSGDVVLSVDGVDTGQLSLQQVADRIRGPAGTAVGLRVQRGDSAFDVSLTRAAPPPSVRTARLDGGVLYVRIFEFDASTATAFGVQLQAGLAGARAVVLDLRNNPGGAVEAAAAVVSEFVPSGVAFELQARSEQPSPVHVSGHPVTAVPLMVLVNGNTASAAEIVAGALSMRRRATLVGSRTFGKDSVQGDFHLSDGADLHLTIERWLLPDGSSVAGGGLKPDQEISLADPTLMFDPTEPQQRPEMDAQLNRALDLLAGARQLP